MNIPPILRRSLFKGTCAVAALLLSFASHAQKKETGGSAPFGKGDNTLGLGIGFGIDYGYYYGGVSVAPAFLATFDHGLIENVGPGTIGIGGIFGFKSAHDRYDDSRWTNIIVAGRGTYHLTLLKDKVPKLDPYGGVMLGFRIYRYSEDYGFYDTDVTSVHPAGGPFVGAKYNFAPAFGVWSELGYDISFLKIGVNFNF